MNPYVWMALAATLCTWLITALGSATVVFFKHPNEKAMNLMLGFAAGVMIAASFWSLLQPAIERAERDLDAAPWLVATAGFLCGAVFMWASDRAVSFTQGRFQIGASREDGRFGSVLMLVLSITLHNIPEGLAVGVAFGALAGGTASREALMGAAVIALGIGLQNFPEGARCLCRFEGKGSAGEKAFSSARRQVW